jgi:hypothetical protein
VKGKFPIKVMWLLNDGLMKKKQMARQQILKDMKPIFTATQDLQNTVVSIVRIENAFSKNVN